MDSAKYSQLLHGVPSFLGTPETGQIAEPTYPLLEVTELGSELRDLSELLTAEERSALRPDEVVVHVHRHEAQLPPSPLTPIEILTKAAGASMPEEIGFMGPTVASVDVSGNNTRSRYEIQHGRDDLIAAMDVKDIFPKLLDTAVVSLASSQGTGYEEFVPGVPYGFERPGSIILVNFEANDPLGLKFRNHKDWRSPFYGSADAPGLFVDAVAHLQSLQPNYLFERTYISKDGIECPMLVAFNNSVRWLVEHMDENPEGLVEYKNPYMNGRGIRNQGWKDSADAIVHKDGEWANSYNGIATIEIQTQAIISLRKAAQIHRQLFNNERLADELEARADNLFTFILENGWVDDELGGHFAMGWDRDDQGSLRRIETKSIDMHNMLRLLDMDDLRQREMAFAVVRNLTSEVMLTRWGSRVMAADEVAYGDLRYHCGVWLDKSNRVAESISMVGLHGLDRRLGGLTTNVVDYFGSVPEHISGEDSEAPVLPKKDVYVFNKRYNEMHLIEQVPPLGQTWGATSELAKERRYGYAPERATAHVLHEFEDKILSELDERFDKAA